MYSLEIVGAEEASELGIGVTITVDVPTCGVDVEDRLLETSTVDTELSDGWMEGQRDGPFPCDVLGEGSAKSLE